MFSTWKMPSFLGVFSPQTSSQPPADRHFHSSHAVEAWMVAPPRSWWSDKLGPRGPLQRTWLEGGSTVSASVVPGKVPNVLVISSDANASTDRFIFTQAGAHRLRRSKVLSGRKLLSSWTLNTKPVVDAVMLRPPEIRTASACHMLPRLPSLPFK